MHDIKKNKKKLIILHHIHINKKEEVKEELISCRKACSSSMNEEKTITHAGHEKEEGYIKYIH